MTPARAGGFLGGVRSAGLLLSIIAAAFCAGYFWNAPRHVHRDTPPPISTANPPPHAPPPQAPPGTAGREQAIATLFSKWRDQSSDDVEVCEELMRWQAADFLSFATGKGALAKALRGALEKGNLSFERRLLTTVARRWCEVDKDGALAWLAGKERYEGDGYKFANAVARVLPEELWRRRGEPGFQRYKDEAIAGLAAKDADAARREFSTLSEEKRAEYFWFLMEGLAVSDPVGMVETIRNGGAKGAKGSGEIAWGALRRRAMELDPATLRRLADAAPDKQRLDDVMAALVSFPNTLLEVASGITPDDERRRSDGLLLVRSAATSLALEDPAAAREMLKRLAPKDAAAAAPGIAAGWALRDPSAALAWAEAEPLDEKTRRKAKVGAFESWLSQDDKAALAWLAAQPAGDARDMMAFSALTSLDDAGRLEEAQSLARTISPGARAEGGQFSMLRLSLSLPAEALEITAAGMDEKSHARLAEIASAAGKHSPRIVREWIERQPAGARRDAALAGLIESGAITSATETRDHIAAIADPVLRARSAANHFQEWKQNDPVAAHAWFSSLEGMDAVVRDVVLKGGNL